MLGVHTAAITVKKLTAIVTLQEFAKPVLRHNNEPKVSKYQSILERHVRLHIIYEGSQKVSKGTETVWMFDNIHRSSSSVRSPDP